MRGQKMTRFPWLPITRTAGASRRVAGWCAVLCAAACAAVAISPAREEACAQSGPPPAEHPNVREIRRLLAEPIILDFEHVSLDNVLKYLEEVRFGLRFSIDPEIQRAGIDLSSRVVDIRVRGVSVESVLNLILGKDLGYLVQLDGLLITTREKVLRHLSVASYPVASLAARLAANAGETVEAALEQLTELIRRHVNSADDPYMADWEGAGGNGAMTYKEGSFVITQTPRGHERVAALLEALERALVPGTVQAGPATSKALDETRARLTERIDLDFEHTSLDNVLKYISEVKRDLNIVPDPELAGAGVDLSARVVDFKVKGISSEEVLNLILAGDLAYVAEPGYVLVTTCERVYQRLPFGAYRVDDLLAPPDSGDFPDWQELVDILKRNINNMADPNVAPWTDEGGPATVDFLGGLLVICQTRAGHERVARLLENVRRNSKGMPVEPSPREKAIAETQALLDGDIRLDLEGTSLDNVLKYMSEVKHNLNLVPDPELADLGVDLSARVVDLKVKGVSVESVLSLILGKDLAYVVRPGYVLVTTREKKYAHLAAVVYPIQDLLRPSPTTGRPADPTALIEALRKTVNQKNDSAVALWVDEGGPAASDVVFGHLVVTQTHEGHQRVRQFLDGLRRAGGLPGQ